MRNVISLNENWTLTFPKGECEFSERMKKWG